MLQDKLPSNRQLKVGEEVKHALAYAFSAGIFHEAELSEIVNISEVRMSPDLKNANVYIYPLGGSKDPKTFIDKIKELAPGLRKIIAQRVHMKYVPMLYFRYDDRLDKTLKLEELFAKIAPESVDQ